MITPDGSDSGVLHPVLSGYCSDPFGRSCVVAEQSVALRRFRR